MSCFLSNLKALDNNSLINFKEKLKSTDILNNYIFNDKKNINKTTEIILSNIYQHFMTWQNVLAHSTLEHPII